MRITRFAPATLAVHLAWAFTQTFISPVSAALFFGLAHIAAWSLFGPLTAGVV